MAHGRDEHERCPGDGRGGGPAPGRIDEGVGLAVDHQGGHGEGGQGLGAVSEIWSWAQRTGRAVPNGPGVVPKPGDLIVFGDQHVGIVRDVLPNGQIQTIEGNYENKVAANVRSPNEATGYVEMN